MNQKEMQWFGIRRKSYYNQYGRCINVSYGLILGLLLDKLLLYLSKGLSVVFPPFAVLLLNRGPKLFSIRFERKFNKNIERFISHLTS